MLRRIRVRASYANVAATVALVLAVGGGAFAVAKIPDSKGVIHSCLDTAAPDKGSLRVTDKACKAGEKALAWNQTGPKGARGLQGLRGLQGIQGIQGVPGPTESTSASNQVPIDSEFDLDGSFNPTIDLNNVNSQGGSQQISPSFPSRIIATATATLENDDATVSAISCKLQISNGTGPLNGLADMAPEHFVTFPALSNYATVVTLTGAFNKPAGTYNVRMVCKESIEGAKVSSASITAIATGQ
jgi:hypothetical protein